VNFLSTGERDSLQERKVPTAERRGLQIFFDVPSKKGDEFANGGGGGTILVEKEKLTYSGRYFFTRTRPHKKKKKKKSVDRGTVLNRDEGLSEGKEGQRGKKKLTVLTEILPQGHGRRRRGKGALASSTQKKEIPTVSSDKRNRVFLF